jgi:tetratricopeptide (TPR) repeat protein
VNSYRIGGAVLAAMAGLLAVSVPASSMAMPARAATDGWFRPAGPGAAVPPLVAWGDSQAILPNTPVAKALSGLPSCAGRPEREPSFATALRDARKLFKGAAARGEKTLDARTYSGTPGRAETFAAGAASAGAPAAALAALLDAERRTPRAPMLLVDASVFLTELGHPADALAFIDHARKLGPVKGAPLGLSDTAAELNNRGFALLGMHRYPAALQTLRQAIRAGGPLLSEASINEAQALHCTGNRAQAFHALLAGAYRQDYDLVKDGVTGPGEESQPPPDQLGFISPGGPPSTLQQLKYPLTNAQAQAAHDGYLTFANFLLQEITSLGKTQDAQYVVLYDHFKHESPITRQRTLEIFSLIGDGFGDSEPAVAKSSDAASAAEDKMIEFESQFSGQDPPSECPHHAQWLSLQENWDTKIRDNWAAVSRYEAPLVANLSDPVAHKIALEMIRISGDFDLNMLANNVVGWSGGESGCTSSRPLAGPGDKGAKAGDPGNCPPTTGPSYKLVISIPKLLDIKVNCESVEATVEGETLITPFVSVEQRFKGETTVFLGVKAGAHLGPFGGGEVESGFYVKTDSRGGFEDFGVCVAPSASGGVKPVLIEYGGDHDLSIVGAIKFAPEAFGFQ